MNGKVLQFPSPAGLLVTKRPHGPTLWQHDVQTPEWRALGSEARLVYLGLLLLADYTTQVATVGRTRLAEAAGIDRANTRRAIAELEHAGLVRVERQVRVGPNGGQVHGRSVYVLLTAPSALRRPEQARQLTLPFRRLAVHEAMQERQSSG